MHDDLGLRQARGMAADIWESITVADLRPGDRVRLRGEFEFDVARIDAPFLGMDAMVCIIEDTPARWHAYAAPLVEPVEARRAG